jgi:hypothetical protein
MAPRGPIRGTLTAYKNDPNGSFPTLGNRTRIYIEDRVRVQDPPYRNGYIGYKLSNISTPGRIY